MKRSCKACKYADSLTCRSCVRKSLWFKGESELAKAISLFRSHLKDDPEYFNGWRANIAVAFYDGILKGQGDNLKLTYSEFTKLLNDIAEKFLNDLIGD